MAILNKEYNPKNSAWRTKVADVTDKGQVTIAVNAFGNEDSDGDISMPGSFKKTLDENFLRVKWYLNHDRTKLLGVPLKGEETPEYLQMTALFNMEKQLSKDTYTDYKLYAENGRTLEHSIGVDPILRDKSDPRKVLEWRLWEFSTLTSWGANPNTPLLDIKSKDKAKDQLEFIQKMIKEQYSDERLAQLEKQVKILTKALEGELMVTCPYCGEAFDYNAYPEHTFEQQVLDSANRYISWMVDDTVYEEMQKLTPEVQSQVSSIISAAKSMNKDMTTKDITNFTDYVYCPKCYSRVYKANIMIQPDMSTGDDTQEEIEEKGRNSSTLLKNLQGIYIKK